MTEVRKKEEYDRETEDAGPDGISEDIEENEEGFSFRGFCEEALPLLLTAYLFIVFCLYPFYLKDGYTDVGKEKFNFYKVMTIGGFSLILPLVLACVSFRVKENIGKEGGAGRIFSGIRLSATDWAVAAYGVSVVISYICSEFKEMALWGEKGWNMGLVTQLAFVLSYF